MDEHHQNLLVLIQRDRKNLVKTLGGRIRLAAAAKGWDKSRLTKEVGVRHRQTVQKWWDDRVKYIEPKYLFKVATKLNLSAHWLQEGPPHSPIPGRHLHPDQERVLATYERMSENYRSSWLRSGEDHVSEVGPSRLIPYRRVKEETNNS